MMIQELLSLLTLFICFSVGAFAVVIYMLMPGSTFPKNTTIDPNESR